MSISIEHNIALKMPLINNNKIIVKILKLKRITIEKYAVKQPYYQILFKHQKG